MSTAEQGQRSDGVEESEALDEPTSPIHPIAAYPPPLVTTVDVFSSKPVKRAAGGRAPEFYGFVAWLLTLLVYGIYILWTMLPDEYIRAAGIEWYPAREWSILLPAWSVMLFLTAYFVYIALGIYNTPALDDMSTLTGELARVTSFLISITDMVSVPSSIHALIFQPQRGQKSVPLKATLTPVSRTLAPSQLLMIYLLP